jgi:hypothetical protein
MLRFILACIFLSLSTDMLFAQQSFPSFPPPEVTAVMDRDQMLYQLGIKLPVLPSKLKDPNAPKNAIPADSTKPESNWKDAYGHIITRSGWGLWNNYDDRADGFFPGKDSQRVGRYTPINLLKNKNGKMITTPEEWWNSRRAEILKDAQELLYGVIPADSVLPKVQFSVSTYGGGEGDAAYIQKEIYGAIDISRYPAVRDTPVIAAVLRIPANATRPVPVMIVYSGFGNNLETYWNRTAPNGWGICTFNPNLLQPDNGAGLTSFLVGLVNKGNWRKPSDWGTIGAWSWGISRLIDYLETDKQVNPKMIGLSGHSRYGKATLVTMGYEQRIAIGFPSDAGSLGTKMNRRHWGQDLENSTGPSEYHWMAGTFFQWAGELVSGQYLPRRIEHCPVDAHSLLALCAPRPVFINAGTRSSWTDPYGMYLTTVYASPVYQLLGKKGMIMTDEKPQIDVAYIKGDIGYRYHEGGHTDAPDWPAFFEFASKYFKTEKQ